MGISAKSLAVVVIGMVVILFPLPSPAQSTDTDTSINRQVSAQELDRLRQTILDETRSNLEGIFEYHDEAGDRNNQLNFYRFGGRANLRLDSGSLLYLKALHTPYSAGDRIFQAAGSNATLGLRIQLSESVRTQIELGGTRFSTGGNTINAFGSMTFASPATSVTVTVARSNIEESLLSVAGIRPVTGPFAGTTVGQVMDNRAVVDGIHRVLPKVDIFANGGAGYRKGRQVDSNFFLLGGGGAGYNIVSAAREESVSLLRASYELNYIGFSDNRLGFGGASMLDGRGRPISAGNIGSDGISPVVGGTRAGIGGYFSPENYFSHVIRGELRGQPTPELEYQITGFVGSQYFTGSERRQAAGFSGTLSVRVSDRYSFPITVARDNFGPFLQQSLLARLIVRF